MTATMDPAAFDDSHLTDDPLPSGWVYDKHLGRRVPAEMIGDDLAELLDDDHLVICSTGNYANDEDRRSDVEGKAARFYARYLKVDPGEQVCARMQAIVNAHSTGNRKHMIDGHYAAVCSSMAGHTGLAATLKALSEVRDGATGHERDVRRSIEGAYKRALTHRDRGEDPCSCPGTFERLEKPPKPAPEDIDENSEPGNEGEAGDEIPRLIEDLTKYLDGDVEPEPTERGMSRNDGTPLLYAGKDHTAIGETEAGKSWLALACAAADLVAGRRVLYLHFEESDARSTVIRLRQMGVSRHHLMPGGAFAFAGIDMPILRPEYLGELIDHRPDLVVIDGVNAAMTLHGWDTDKADGVGTYRARLVAPFLSMGASTLALDHVVKNAEQRGNGYAMGSAMKLNMVSGASFLLESVEASAPGKCGQTSVYVVKDRPGALRALAGSAKTGRRALFGSLWIDSTTALTEVRLTTPSPDAFVEDDTRPVDAKALKVLTAVARLHSNPGRNNPPSTAEIKRVERIGVRKTDVQGYLDTLAAHGLIAKETGDGGTRWLPLQPAAEKALQPAGTVHPDDV